MNLWELDIEAGVVSVVVHNYFDVTGTEAGIVDVAEPGSGTVTLSLVEFGPHVFYHYFELVVLDKDYH